MILKSIRAECFAGLNPGAEVRFAPGITVVHGPNGTGKSSLFRALTWALYQRHGVTGQDATREARPAGTSLAPRVVVEFETRGATWRVDKRFLARTAARLERLQDGRFVPQEEGPAVEDRLRELLGSDLSKAGVARAALRGMGEVLLVDQGALRFTDALGARASARLQALVGEVATTQEAHGLFRRLQQRYDAVFTPGGDFKKGKDGAPPVRLAEELEGVERELGLLRARAAAVDALEAQLAGGAGAEAQAEATARRLDEELEAARAREGAFRQARFELQTREERAREARAGAERHAKSLGEMEAARAARARARAGLDGLAPLLASAEAALADEERALAAAEAAQAADPGEAQLLRHDAGELEDARRARDADARLRTARAALGRWEERTRELADVEARLGARVRPTAAQLQALRALGLKVQELEARRHALSLRVRLSAEGAVTLEAGGTQHAVAAGGTLELTGREPFHFRVPGVGTFELAGPSADARAKADAEAQEAARALAAARAPFGEATWAELEALGTERVELEARARALQAARAEVLPGEPAVREARARAAEAEAELATLLGRYPAWGGAAPGEEWLAKAAARLEDERRRVEELRRTRAAHVATLRRAVERTRKEAERLREERHRLDVEARGAEKREEALAERGLTPQGLEALEAEARAREGEAEAARAALEVLGDVPAALERARRAQAQHAEARARALAERQRREGELEAARRDGLHLRLAALEERAAVLSGELARARLDAEALRALHGALHAEQQRTTQALLEPVTRKMTRLLRAAVGQEVQVAVGEGLLPERLVPAPGSAALELAQLSAGTQDQVAMMARLALGELYCRANGRHAFVLDDPLVNTDAGRRGRILDILARSAEHLQLVLFTCHPEHYYGLEGAESVSLEEARARLAAAATAPLP